MHSHLKHVFASTRDFSIRDLGKLQINYISYYYGCKLAKFSNSYFNKSVYINMHPLTWFTIMYGGHYLLIPKADLESMFRLLMIILVTGGFMEICYELF